MIVRPTVLIIGAGASAEFGMPTGPALQELIAARLNTALGEDLWRIIGAQLGQDRKKELAEAAPALARVVTRFNSIDEALHFERGNKTIVELGKLCIAYEILRAERDSKLYGGRVNAECEITWANRLLKLAVGGLDRKQITSALFQSLTVVNFNYDRVLEQYLFDALQQDYGVEKQLAAEALSTDRFKVLRPYGSVGALDWQSATHIKFGGDPNEIQTIAAGIRTFTEEQESGNVQSIQTAVGNGRIFIVVGFGYHKQNITMLSSRQRTTGRQGFLTVHNIPEENDHAIAYAMQIALGFEFGPSYPPPELFRKTGFQLLRDLQPAISLAVG